MKERETFPGKTYAVTSPNGCTVTTENGLTLAEVEAGKQGYFVAVSGNVTLSDADAKLTELFNLAPYQKLRLLGVVGGDSSGLPAGYRLVEYLQSDGAQYINTDWLLQTPITVAVDVENLSNVISYIFGALSRKNPKDRAQFRYMLCFQPPEELSYDTGAGWNMIYIPQSNRMSIEFETTRLCDDAAVTLKVDDKIYTPYNTDGDVNTQYPNESPLFLFSCSVNNAASTTGPIRIYSCSIQSEGKKKFDFVPCLDSTGAPCMFDIVSRKTFYNRGTGDFLYPSASTTYSLRRVLPDWGKLTENGLRRLYHAPANYKGELYDYALENGFKPIVETERPEDGYWTPRWTETEDEIVLEWVETDPTMPEETT